MTILNRKVLLNEISNVRYSENKKINIINVDYNFKDAFSKIKINSNKYIEKCFDLSLKIIKKKKKLCSNKWTHIKKNIFKKKIFRNYRIYRAQD